jgi:hypothetical protein
MTMQRSRYSDSGRKRQKGAAMLITSLVLVLVVMMALSSLNQSEEESTGGARVRSATRALQAADAGIQFGLGRLTQSPPDLTAFDLSLPGQVKVQSRSQLEPTPQDLLQVGLGEAADGYSVNVGSGASSINRVYLLTVTASSSSSTATVEAKLSRESADVNGY